MVRKKKKESEPVQTQTTPGELLNAPNVFYQKFFNQFSEIDTLPVAKWKVVHLLAYFCRIYENHYKVKYSFKFDKTPSKSYEVFQINKIAGMLTTDPVVLKDYIDFVFAKKIGQSKKRITVIGFIAHIDFVNEFKFNFLKSQEITRSSTLSASINQILSAANVINVTTYGQLSFFLQALSADEDIMQNQLVIQLQQAGLNLAALEKLK
jgi:hypothetical protein